MTESPFKVHCGDVEDDSFKPQNHEEPLGKGAISDALTITSCLKTKQNKQAIRK